jgi:hypothetical protein
MPRANTQKVQQMMDIATALQIVIDLAHKAATTPQGHEAIDTVEDMAVNQFADE